MASRLPLWKVACILAYTSSKVTASSPAALLDSRSGAVIQRVNNETWPSIAYQTETSVNTPYFQIDWDGTTVQDGVILLTPVNFDGSDQIGLTGPTVVSNWGDLVWQGPTTNASGPYAFHNFQIQTLNDVDYLSYWHGYELQGVNASIGYGNVTFLDQNYQPKWTVCPQLGLNVGEGIPHDCDIDYNEQYLTPWGTLLVTVYNLTQTDLTSVNGSANGYILDSQIHEINLTTSESIWSWSSLDHIALNASQLPLTDLAANESVAWDYVHINSVSPYGDDKLLVSGRHTWDVFAIDRSTGDIVWSFNGEYGGDWGVVPMEATFSWQHHTRVHDYGDNFVMFSMFGNHNYAGANATSGTAPSVGRDFNLTLPASHSISPLTLNTYNESGSLWSDSWGSFDYLPTQQNATHRFMSYGQLPLLREFQAGPGANVTALRWEARYGYDNKAGSYRSFKGVWNGQPTTEPSLSILQNGTAYVSWNGATDVSSWAIYYGAASNETLALKYIAKSQGFETAVDLDSGCYYFQALSNTGAGSGNSTTVCI